MVQDEVGDVGVSQITHKPFEDLKQTKEFVFLKDHFGCCGEWIDPEDSEETFTT